MARFSLLLTAGMKPAEENQIKITLEWHTQSPVVQRVTV